MKKLLGTLLIAGAVLFSCNNSLTPANSELSNETPQTGVEGTKACSLPYDEYNNGWSFIKEYYGGDYRQLPFYDRWIIGDYDGDGDQDIVGTSELSEMKALFSFSGTSSWSLAWNSNTAGSANPLYSYTRGVAGDFDGDGKDEIFLYHINLKLVKYLGGRWTTIWSADNSHMIYPYKDRLLVGDFDGDNKDELLGCGDWNTMFHYNSDNQWQWGWSTYNDNPAIKAYLTKTYWKYARVGDFDKDGRDEVLGLATWATMFHYTDNNWDWGWSSYSGNLGGWKLPLGADIPLAGDLDATHTDDEILFFDVGTDGGEGSVYNYIDGTFKRRWTTVNYVGKAVDNWPIAAPISSNTEYHLVRAQAGAHAYLMARRDYCNVNLVRMYKLYQAYNE